MRVLFCTTGGLGHLQPLRPLAKAIRKRGHEVAWVTAPDALPWLAGEGFDLFAAGPTFEVSRRLFRATHAEVLQLAGEQQSEFTFPRLFGDVLGPAMLAGLEQAVLDWRPDVVVHEPAALAAPLVCQHLGLRHVTHGYGLRPPHQYLEDAMNFFGPHWRARGLAPPAQGGVYRHLDLDIVPWVLQPSIARGRDRVFHFNPYRPETTEVPALPASLRLALEGRNTRQPRIYVTFGTVFNRSPALMVATRAAARLGATVVVTVGADGDLSRFAHLGSNVFAHRFLAQGALLPHCDGVVSHGGAGTLLAAASHGVPHLVLPQAADHFRNARAITAAEAGCTVEPGQQTVEAVAASLALILKDGRVGAGAKLVAREMGAMPSVVEAAIQLERCQARAWGRECP